MAAFPRTVPVKDATAPEPITAPYVLTARSGKSQVRDPNAQGVEWEEELATVQYTGVQAVQDYFRLTIEPAKREGTVYQVTHEDDGQVRDAFLVDYRAPTIRDDGVAENARLRWREKV